MKKNSSLIVIEGASDGIGKTTQLQLLKEHLIKDEIGIVTHHFPSYGTIQGQLVEKYLKGELGSTSELTPYFINTLYAIDRAYTWHNILKKEYEKGKTILLDRYTTSSIIYQAALFDTQEKRVQFAEDVCIYEYQKLLIAKPDLVIFLKAPFDLITEIRNKRNQSEETVKDIHETDLDYLKKVYDNAIFMSEHFGWDTINCNSNSKMRSIDDIHEDIYKLVKKKTYK